MSVGYPSHVNYRPLSDTFYGTSIDISADMSFTKTIKKARERKNMKDWVIPIT